MAAAGTTQGELPVTLNWYREAANWLVGLAAAATAGSIALLETVRVAQASLRLSFALGLVGLSAAVVSGILFYWWLLKYANLLEVDRRCRAASWPLLPSGPQDQKRQADLNEAKTTYAFFHNALLWAFTLGLLAPASVGIILLFGKQPVPPDVPAYTVISIDEASRGAKNPQTIALVVEAHSGQTWAIRSDSNGNLSTLPFGRPLRQKTQPKDRP